MDDDVELVDRLRAGDDAAFVELLHRYQPRLMRLAEATVRSRAIAEEVTQETWLAVVRGVHHFEGRSSFRTWIFHVLLNRAHTAARQEQRAGRPETDIDERFSSSGAWEVPPAPWADRVDDRVVAEQLAGRVRTLLPDLPPAQRQVVILRDMEHLDADQVAQVLGISDANVRVLLHRGRARLRSLLEAEMKGAG